MSIMKEIRITLENEEYNLLKKMKAENTWKEFLMNKKNEEQ